MSVKVSFLVTYYNQVDYVRQSLESILSQNISFDYEILVADDGSSDGTCDIVKEYIERFPDKIKLSIMPREKDVVYNPVERVSLARIFLLRQAVGEYFCVLDGDDWYCNDNFVQKGIEVLDNDSCISVCSFLYKNWYGPDRVESMQYIKNEKVISATDYISYMYIPAGACIFRRPVSSEKLNLLKDIGIFDDNDIIISMLEEGCMYHIPVCVYCYRQTEGSVWNSSGTDVKNLINVWGYEIDKLYSSHRISLKYRYGNAILELYKSRKRLSNLNIPKNRIYFEYAQKNPTEYLGKILNHCSERFFQRVLFAVKIMNLKIIFKFYGIKYRYTKLIGRDLL